MSEATFCAAVAWLVALGPLWSGQNMTLPPFDAEGRCCGDWLNDRKRLRNDWTQLSPNASVQPNAACRANMLTGCSQPNTVFPPEHPYATPPPKRKPHIKHPHIVEPRLEQHSLILLQRQHHQMPCGLVSRPARILRHCAACHPKRCIARQPQIPLPCTPPCPAAPPFLSSSPSEPSGLCGCAHWVG